MSKSENKEATETKCPYSIIDNIHATYNFSCLFPDVRAR